MQRGNIYLIESQNRQILAETFMRFQEYYESPEFKGKVFSVEDFAHWYARKFGAFTYSRDWYGFNIPGTVLAPFRNGDFAPLTSSEQRLINFCKNARIDSYIIGATPSAEYFKETVQHEFVHGAFYTNLEYRREVTDCVNRFNVKSVYKGLLKMGYCKDVATDETNAYVLVEPESLNEFVHQKETANLRRKLIAIFKRYFGFSIIDSGVQNLIARTEHILI